MILALRLFLIHNLHGTQEVMMPIMHQIDRLAVVVLRPIHALYLELVYAGGLPGGMAALLLELVPLSLVDLQVIPEQLLLLGALIRGVQLRQLTIF